MCTESFILVDKHLIADCFKKIKKKGENEINVVKHKF